MNYKPIKTITNMKKTILFAAVMMLAASAFAQRKAGTWSALAKVGLNIADYSNTGDADTKPRLGIVSGIGVAYQIDKRIGLSAEALYSQQGTKETEQLYASPMSETVTYKTDYVNFPILVSYYPVKGLAVKFGVQPAVNVNSTYDLSSGPMASGTLNGCNTFDFSIPVGLSYEFDRVFIDARYNIGLTNVGEQGSLHNRVIQITAGLKLDFGKKRGK